MERIFIGIACLFMSSTCALAQEQMIKSKGTEAAPAPGKALVIFVRHSFVMGAYQAPVLDVDVKNADPKPGQLPVEDRVVGILSGYSKIAYQAEPGEHTFMTVPASGGSALVAKATLQAEKTYFFLVKPIWGFSPAYALTPARQDPKAEIRVDSADLAGWLKGTEFFEPTEFAAGWLNGNRPSVLAKKAEALAAWEKLPPAEKEKLTLQETDGK
jgi:hypothetical protein